MGYEIDYIAVGDGERSGDAICLRYGNLLGPTIQQTVITIDGGTLESGNAVVEHIRKFYGTNTVNVALLSHPDSDHASGMRRILEEMDVRQVAMHLPWTHSADVKELLDDSGVSTNSVREKTKRNLSTAREIEQLANSKNIPIVEPFAGIGSKGGLTVLGPSVEFYQEMLSSFKFMPGVEAKSAGQNLTELLKTLGKGVVNWIDEHWFKETLQEPDTDATSPENNSSVIFMLQIDGKKLLFTGDAGVPALHGAVDFANGAGIALENINFFDVPHHGSKRNLGPSILNRLFGQIRMTDSKDWLAYVSAAKDGGPKHPHKKVTNALRRRGAGVYVTAGTGICHWFQSPIRSGWVSLEPLPFYQQVESDD